MAGIGGFVAGKENVIDYLQYNMRSQTFAKSLPMPMVMGALKGSSCSGPNLNTERNFGK